MTESNGLIEERLEYMWSKTQKYMEEGTFEEHLPTQMDYFTKEVLPLVALKAFFTGISKLDEESASVVLKEVGTACGDFALAHMALLGISVPCPHEEIDSFIAAHEKGENITTCGLSNVTREDQTATLVMTGGCACPLFRILDIEPTSNHCICTKNHLQHVYEAGVGKDVNVELLETYNRGGDCCRIRMSW